MKSIKKIVVSFSIGLSILGINANISLSQIPPYGPLVNEYNSRAASAISRGDYDTAIINYQKAADAAKDLDDEILRMCGLMGAIANIQGAQAAKEYLKKVEISPTTLSKAGQIEEIMFRAAWNVFDVMYPELENRCP